MIVTLGYLRQHYLRFIRTSAGDSMRQTAVSAALLAWSVLVASAAAGQAPTPDSLGRLVVGRFADATPAAFDSVDPDPLGRALIRSAIDRHLVRGRGLTRVLAAD